MTVGSVPLDLQFDRAGRQLTVYVAGDLDLANSPELEAAVRKEADPSTTSQVWIDLSLVRFCDEAGVQAFEQLHTHLTATEGHRFVLFQPTGHVSRILQTTGADQTIEVVGRRP